MKISKEGIILMLAISLIFAGCANTTDPSESDTTAGSITSAATVEETTTTTSTTTTTEPETEDITTTTTETIEASEPETETTTAEPEEEEKYFTVEECLEKIIRENYGMEIVSIRELEDGSLIVYIDGELENVFGYVQDHISVLIDMDLYHSGEMVNIDNFIVYDNLTIGYNPYLNP